MKNFKSKYTNVTESPTKAHVKELYKLREDLEKSETRRMDLHSMYGDKIQVLKKEWEGAKKCGEHWQEKYEELNQHYKILSKEYEELKNK